MHVSRRYAEAAIDTSGYPNMITIVALLTIRDIDAFTRFERQAAAIMKNHGGRIDSAFRPAAVDSDATNPVHEVHVLKFPDLAAFDSYKSDTRLFELGVLREQAIAHTTVYVSAQEVGYFESE